MFCWMWILNPELLLIKNVVFYKKLIKTIRLYIMCSSNFDKQGTTEIALYLVTRMLFLFKKIIVIRSIFRLSGKTSFAKEMLKICFRITNISSGTLLTTSADISSYPELLFVLKLANALSSSTPVRLMVLRRGPS